jgi:hypothetical protein
MGRWQLPGEGGRGRGSQLMRHCADDVRIDRGFAGTTVVIRRRLTGLTTR